MSFPLHDACACGNLKEIRRLVKTHQVDEKNLSNLTPLWIAAACTDDGRIVQVLVNANADPNIENGDHSTAIQIACCRGHHNVVESLLENKAAIDESSLCTAAESGHHRVVDIVLKHDGSLNKGAALRAAVRKGHENVAKTLLANQVDIETSLNERGQSALWLCKSYETSMLGLLLKNRADPNRVDASGNTLWRSFLGESCNNGTAAVKLLCDAGGANVRVIDGDGLTPLLMACKGDSATMREILGRAPEMVNVEDANGNTPLHLMADCGRKEDIQLLLQNAADPNIQNKKGNTPIFHAIQQYTIERTQKKKFMDEEPIYFTEWETKMFDGFQCLVDGKADLNIGNKIGLTPMYFAAYRGNETLVRFLGRNGADPNAPLMRVY